MIVVDVVHRSRCAAACHSTVFFRSCVGVVMLVRFFQDLADVEAALRLQCDAVSTVALCQATPIMYFRPSASSGARSGDTAAAAPDTFLRIAVCRHQAVKGLARWLRDAAAGDGVAGFRWKSAVNVAYEDNIKLLMKFLTRSGRMCIVCCVLCVVSCGCVAVWPCGRVAVWLGVGCWVVGVGCCVLCIAYCVLRVLCGCMAVLCVAVSGFRGVVVSNWHLLVSASPCAQLRPQ